MLLQANEGSTSMMMKLYYTVGTCALAAHLALEEAGADYEAVRVDIRNGENLKPEFLAINPKGAVPVLVTERGVLTENPAILAYIAQRFPDKRLLPLDDPFDYAKALAFNSYLCSTIHPHHSHRLRGKRWAEDPAALTEMARMVPQNLTKCFSLIEAGLGAGPWVLGEQFSVCDAYLFTVANWLEGDAVDARQFPKVHTIRERVRMRPSLQHVLSIWRAVQPPAS
jgi:glutathione S-transferase